MAISLDGLIGLLERWSRWKKLNATPERVDHLESEIKMIKQRIDSIGDGKLLCSECGKGPVSIKAVTEPFGKNGQQQIIYRTCSECGSIGKINGAILKRPDADKSINLPYEPL